MAGARTDVVAALEGVTKEYRLGQERSNARNLIPGRRGEGSGGTVFRALDDVSFEVQHGEAVGIIGANGAGKSTVLKLLAKILEPTRGTIRTSDRCASLIELGVGFDPELTGRENVFFAGDMIGLSRAQVRRHFDDIVAFAGIEEFLDMPVKRYSTGMAARLGFAVATAVQPELLVVDEVLSVGDYEFQRRSLERIRSIHRAGSTLVIVTHDLWMINVLCERLLLLERGRLVLDGPAAETIAHYIGPAQQGGGGADDPAMALVDYLVAERDRSGVSIDWMECDPPAIDPGGAVTIRARITVHRPIEGGVLAMALYTSERAVYAERELGPSGFLGERGSWVVEARIPSVPLSAGKFQWRFVVLPEDDRHYVQDFPSALALATAELTISGDLLARPGLKLDTEWEVAAGRAARSEAPQAR